ncbi:hypothetical protein [Streptomyces noursei]|uniref:hypothetical protein n=1 Tax=Streptomyces noursei TaxID=1971 RepID=UPI00381DBA92
MSSSADAADAADPAASVEAVDMASENGQPMLDWYDFSGRDVPDVPGEFYSPESELTGVVRRAAEDLEAAREEARTAADAAGEPLYELAVLAGRLDQLTDAAEGPLVAQDKRRLHGQLRILKNQMLQILADNGIELRDPTGLPAADVLDWVDVTGWLHRPEFDAEVVARTEERAVFHEGRTVRFARVQMGAPAEQEPAQVPVPVQNPAREKEAEEERGSV